jgi:hypothetical protein
MLRAAEAQNTRVALTVGGLLRDGSRSPNDDDLVQIMMVAGAGFETYVTRFSKLLMARDFWSKTLVSQQLGDISEFSRVPMQPLDSTLVLETSLTTSAKSRHTLIVQAAGAGSHKPRVGGGGRVSGAARFECPLPQRSIFIASVTVLPTKHLFGHNGTMMTRANSRRTGGGSPIHFAGHKGLDHISTQALPHTGITGPSLVLERDGRIRGNRSHHVAKSTA